MTSPFPPGFGLAPFATDADAARLCHAFADCTLPKSAWTHRAHLTAALWHLERSPHGPAALAAMRTGIKRFNRSVGTADTETSGYHETITVLYLRIIAGWRRDAAPGGGFAARANRLYDDLGGRDLPYRHYSKDRLMSVEARVRFVEPDLVPLPGW